MACITAPDLSWLRPLAKGLGIFWREVVLPILVFGLIMTVWLVFGAPIVQPAIAFYVGASEEDQMALLNLLGVVVITVWFILHILRRMFSSRVVIHEPVPTSGLGRMVAAGGAARAVPENLREAWWTTQGEVRHALRRVGGRPRRARRDAR